MAEAKPATVHFEGCSIEVDNAEICNIQVTLEHDTNNIPEESANVAVTGDTNTAEHKSLSEDIPVDIDLTREQVDIDLTVDTVDIPLSFNDKNVVVPVNAALWDEIRREVLTITQNIYIPAIVSCSINGVNFKALLDTGATVTLVSHRVVQATHTSAGIEDYDSGPVRTATGSCMNVLGNVKVTIKIGSLVSITCKAIVVKDLSKDVIIGKDVLKLTKAKLDMEKDTVTFQGCTPIPFGEAIREAAMVETEPSVFRAYTDCEVSIPPKTQLAIPVSAVKYLQNDKDTVLVIGTNEDREEADYVITSSITRGDAVACCVTNVTNGTITIPKGECIATFEVLALDTTQRTQEELAKGRAFGDNKTFQPSDIRLGDGLTPSQKSAVHTLLAKYADVFQENLATPGKLRVAPFVIDLIEGATPKPQRNYRKSELEHMQIKANNDDKLMKGVCELSDSAFPAPVIMAPKKDGKLRLCVDLRYINTLTVPIVLEMPRADDMFYAVRGAKYFSLADATWGYWQIKLDEKDRYKAAYITREGVFQPTVMDFGMKNAPAVWQRSMNTIFSGLLWEQCLIYIDDLLVYSKDFDEHLTSLERCLERCRRFNLKLRPSKCTFFGSRIPFLGHMISGDGLEMDDKKVEAITKMSVPTTPAKLNSFVCIAQYYREFIKGFATIVKPLRDLITGDKYTWTPIHQSAFDRVKEELSKKVVLAHPYPDKPFVLECDASNYGLGFILSQEDEKRRLRVVAFGSRALTSQERNYSATERECLAVLEGVKKYHIYLHGTKFKIITDHKALIWLMTHKDPSSKLMRWALKLQQYQFTIEHRAGAKHANADTLSRLVEEEPRDKTIKKQRSCSSRISRGRRLTQGAKRRQITQTNHPVHQNQEATKR